MFSTLQRYEIWSVSCVVCPAVLTHRCRALDDIPAVVLAFL